jgi:peptidoglycan/xylan/chitin deacetylase (PgdA/CDA1 family)
MRHLSSVEAPLEASADGRSGMPLLYLTFDDGPTSHTPEILELLSRHEAAATFFVLGKRIAEHEDILLAMHAAGHSVGNHSYSHESARTLDYPTLECDMDRCTEAIQNTLPTWHPTLCRPPYGHLSVEFLRYAIRRHMRIVMWTKNAADERASSADVIEARLEVVQEGDIILFHDEFPVTCEALDELIPRWKESGYNFAKL